MPNTIYETIYDRLVQLGLDFDNLPESAKSSSGGFMDLHFDFLRREGGTLHISLAHYYEQNGDLVPDPDMEIRVFPLTKIAGARTFQDTYGYRAAYPEKGKVDVKAEKELNQFLAQWLKNCLDQGHSFKKTEGEAAHG